MEYRFERTVHGPAVVSSDEVVYFFEHAQLQDYIDEDPDFFNKAFAFCQETMAEYGDMLARAVTEDVVGVDRAGTIMQYWGAVQELRRVQHQMTAHQQGFPGLNPQF